MEQVDGGQRPPEVAAAIRSFAFRLKQARDQTKFEGTNSRSNQTLADKAHLSLNTVKNALGGKSFPTRVTVAAIAEACKDPSLVRAWDAAREVIDEDSPRYGEPWPPRAPGTPLPQSPTEDLDSTQAELEEDAQISDSDEPATEADLNVDDVSSADAGESTVEASEVEAPSPMPWWRRRRVQALVVGAVVVVVGVVVTLAVLRSMTPAVKPMVRFNALGGSTTSYIEVYRGPSSSPNDKIAVGGYQSGDTALAVCKKEGRLVKSDTAHGEEPRSSTTWVQIDGQTKAFATMTYADMDPTALEQLPTC